VQRQIFAAAGNETLGWRAVLNSDSGGVMAPPTNGNQRIQFGIFEVDIKAGELRRNGTRVRLQEQPFQILTISSRFCWSIPVR